MKRERTSPFIALLIVASVGSAAADNREMVSMPEMMKTHMLGNMRDHVVALHEILTALSKDDLDQAAAVAEERLGMSSMNRHGARHMAQVMPKEMGVIGMGMHKAASRFSRTAEEGERIAAYNQLNQITAGCVACHARYRIH